MAKYDKYGFDKEDDSEDDGYGKSSYKSSYGSYGYGSSYRKSTFWDKYDDDSTSSTSYWIKGSLFSKKYGKFSADTGSKHDHFVLAQYLRAISNFVNILTGRKDIPVTYNSEGKNCTDGKRIFLSASINEKDFDSNVGLALHESSHIIYTDMEYVKQNVWDNFDNYMKDKVLKADGKPFANTRNKVSKVGNKRGIIDTQAYFHTILNIVEDLYIDAMTYAEAEGYRNYYKSLYQKFFGDISIVKGFYDERFMEKTADSYMFHLCNMRNPNRNLDALPSLDKIWETLDLQNIRRLSTQQDRIDLAINIFSTILQNLDEVELCDECGNPMPQGQGEGEGEGEQGQGEQGQAPQGQGQGEGEQGQGEGGQGQGEGEGEGEQGQGQGQGPQGQGKPHACGKCGREHGVGEGEGEGGQGQGRFGGILRGKLQPNPNGAGGSPNGVIELNDDSKTTSTKNGLSNVDIDSLEELSDDELQKLIDIVQKQLDFTLDKLKKEEVDSTTLENIEAVNEMDIEEKYTAKELTSNLKGIKTYVLKSVSKAFLNSELARSFGLYSNRKSNSVEDGIRLGRMLASKIQLRNDSKTATQRRLKAGKVDSRLIYELGCDKYDIFKKISVTEYSPSYIHISIDQSGSMDGHEFEESMKFATIMASASKHIKNLRVVVSTRTCISGAGQTMNGLPFIMIIFDSKRDDLTHIRNVFPCVRATGSTPEGITFEAIMNEMLVDSAGADTYFINICDGQPGYSYYGQDMSISYGGKSAEEHSRKQLDKMSRNGIRTMTYYIGSASGFKSVQNAYIKNCFHIASASQLSTIARMLNKELLNGTKKTH